MFTTWTAAAYISVALGAGLATWVAFQLAAGQYGIARALKLCLIGSALFLAGWYGHPGQPIASVPWGALMVSHAEIQARSCHDVLVRDALPRTQGSLRQRHLVRLLLDCRGQDSAEGGAAERPAHSPVRPPELRASEPLTLDV